MDAGPTRFYVYYRDKKRAQFLFSNRPRLEHYKLARMQPVSFRARDGLLIHGYLTLPALPKAQRRKLPLIGGDELLALVSRELQAWSAAAVGAGISRERIVLDPGFGFGKNFEENYPLLARLGELSKLGFPLLAGTSRKGFIGRTLAHQGKDAAVSERLYGTIAAITASILQGAHVVRVHDVKPAVEAARIADAIVNSAAPSRE